MQVGALVHESKQMLSADQPKTIRMQETALGLQSGSPVTLEQGAIRTGAEELDGAGKIL